jgi:hypothetical protein
MDTRTGMIEQFSKEEMKGLDPERYERVHREQMTAKQEELMQVSKHDNRSELGKIFTGKRKNREKRERRKRRGK